MEKKRKIKTIFKYISLGLAALTYGFILYQSTLNPDKSGAWENWAKGLWKDLLNERLELKENVVVVQPESLELSPSNYSFNVIAGYNANEIPVGCEKQLRCLVAPENTTNKSIIFTASPSENVNLIQSGNTVTVETLKTGDVTIQAKSVADNSLIKEYTYSVVNKKAPSSFSCGMENVTITKGNSELISLDAHGSGNINTEILSYRYYDFGKLNYTSSNESVAVVRGQYIKGLNEGSTDITVSNGVVTKVIHVTVENNSNTIVPVDSLSIGGLTDVNIMGIERSEYCSLTPIFENELVTDKNVIWSVDNPAVAVVTPDGKVYGYRKVDSANDVSFKVKATSVDNPSIEIEHQMYLRHVVPSNISLSSTLSKDMNGNYILNTGKTSSLKISYGPENVTKSGYNVLVSKEDVVSINKNSNAIEIVGLKEGSTAITISSAFDDSVKSETIKINIVTRELINEENDEDFSRTVRKYISGHAFLFMLAAIFTSMYLFLAHSDKPHKILFPALLTTPIFGFLFAWLSEYIQTFVPGRSGLWSDVWIDLNGYGAGALLVWILVIAHTIVTKVKNKKKTENDE